VAGVSGNVMFLSLVFLESLLRFAECVIETSVLEFRNSRRSCAHTNVVETAEMDLSLVLSFELLSLWDFVFFLIQRQVSCNIHALLALSIMMWKSGLVIAKTREQLDVVQIILLRLVP